MPQDGPNRPRRKRHGDSDSDRAPWAARSSSSGAVSTWPCAASRQCGVTGNRNCRTHCLRCGRDLLGRPDPRTHIAAAD
eukprot:3137847-Pyramimonas_sp.AAC.1